MSIIQPTSDDLQKLETDFVSNIFEVNSKFNLDSTNNTLSSNISQYTLKLRRADFVDEKALTSFIKNTERLIRISPEYKYFVNYVKEILGLGYCTITGEIVEQTTIELHHHPFTLYDIVNGLICEQINQDIEISSFEIALAATELHYQLKVPFVMLISSLHEKFHNGFLKIPMELVYGDYKYLLNRFRDHLTDSEYSKIIEYVSINKSNCGWEQGYKWIVDNGNNI